MARYDYKVYPLNQPHPAFQNDNSYWMPVLSVRVSNPATRGNPSPRIEAIIDSGAPECLFHASIGRAIGLQIESGIKYQMGGIVAGAMIEVYYHDVKLWAGSDHVHVRAGFSDQFSVAGILGRRGFFENFIVTFDPSAEPPGFDLQRLGRA